MSYDPLIVYPKEPKLIAYGWGIVDKSGPTNQFISAGNERLNDYALEMMNRARPDDAPFQVVELFYKEEE